jgi:magnesium and cobalt transporter
MSNTDSTSSETPEKPQRSRARNWWRSLLGRGDTNSLRDSLEEMIVEHDETGRSLTEQERGMLANILSFGELRVDDVMVPRVDVVALEESATLDEVLRVFRESNHSRWPIYRETLDDPLGMVHIKDIVKYLTPGLSGEALPPFSLKSLKRDVLFVPPSMPTLDLLVKMQTTRMHLALVIDEYGGTDGLVSIEDLMEEIVGDIEDEHDEEEGPDFVKRADGSIDANARAPIEDLEELLGVSLVDEDSEDEVETLAGLVFSLAGHVPVRGELTKHPSGIEFEVRDADPRRIKKLRIHLPSEAGSSSAPSAAES